MANTGNRGINFPEQQHQHGHEAGRTGHQPQQAQDAGRMSSQQGQGSHQESGLGGMVGTMKEKAQDFASDVASRAGDTWESARQGAQQAASAVADSAQDTFFGVRDFLGRYPFATLCAGFFVGFLCSRACDMMYDNSRYNWRS